jgi:L-fucose isomerase-like protein
MEPRKFLLGLAPTRRNVFSKEDSLKYKKLIENKLNEWDIEFVNIDDINSEGLLYSVEDANRATRKFINAEVDAVFSPHCNFGTEDAVATLGRNVGKPFLLWGPRDEMPTSDGTRLRDSQCGLFATSKMLRRFNVPFAYITNSRVDSNTFEIGMKRFVASAATANSFLGARIGQVSTRPEGFLTVMVNEGELLERWGISIVPVSLVEIVSKVDEKSNKIDNVLASEIAGLKDKIDFGRCSEKSIIKLAALKLVMVEWAHKASLNAIAFQCWSALQDALNISPCLANAEVTELGIPVCCETDVHGALSSILLQNAIMNSAPIFFADLTIRHPENENSELLWHCGPFPKELAAKNSAKKVCGHYILPSASDGCCEWRLKDGDITVVRFDGDHGNYSLFLGQAKTTHGPYMRGTYVWIEVDDWPKWEHKLIYGPYIHHVACAYGHVADVLYQACQFIPGLRPDAIEPSEEKIMSSLR